MIKYRLNFKCEQEKVFLEFMESLHRQYQLLYRWFTVTYEAELNEDELLFLKIKIPELKYYLPL